MAKACLIIRTNPGAQKTAARVRGLGFEAIILPAANTIATLADIEIDGVQAILITSSNAPRLAKIPEEALSLPIFAVGDATAEAAINRGFINVISAGGDASALAVLVADRLKPKDGAILHLRGTEVAGDVHGLLETCGFEFRNSIVYDTIDCEDFKTKLPEALAQNSGVVLFHSPKGAQRFIAACAPQNVKNWVALGISQAAIKIFKDENWPWSQILVADNPNEMGLLDELKDLDLP